MEVKLVIVGGKRAGTEIPVPGPKLLIGRGEDCHIRPQSHMVSRKHCAILLEEGSAVIEDFGSTNGTIVNDELVNKRRDLKNGDHIKVGPLELEVHMTVSVAGPKKPKVRTVQEAAARTVASAAANDDDLDISGWLDDDAEPAVPAPKKPAAVHDTSVGKVMEDTVSMPAVSPSHKESEKEKAKVTSHFRPPPKPKAESSRSAAEDMLKKFFHRKAP